MIGMNFLSFLILAAVSVVVVAGKSLVIKRSDTGDLLADVVVAWIGAWLGSPVLGHWFEAIAYQQVFIIPAFLGAVAALILKTTYSRLGSVPSDAPGHSRTS